MIQSFILVMSSMEINVYIYRWYWTFVAFVISFNCKMTRQEMSCDWSLEKFKYIIGPHGIFSLETPENVGFALRRCLCAVGNWHLLEAAGLL